jgi:hypothetical protein
MTYTTSGVRQIILGFGKIPVIHKEVALKYGFDATNSILYDDTNLSSALLSVWDSANNYNAMVNSISTMRTTIYKLSLKNLESSISKIVSSFESS